MAVRLWPARRAISSSPLRTSRAVSSRSGLRSEAYVLQQRLERLTVDGPRALRPPRQAALQPVVHRLPDRVRGRAMQAAVKLVVRRFELVPDLGLGPAGDLAPDPLAVRTEADRDRPDIAVLCPSCEERNSLFGSPFGSPLREPIPERGSELVRSSSLKERAGVKGGFGLQFCGGMAFAGHGGMALWLAFPDRCRVRVEARHFRGQ